MKRTRICNHVCHNAKGNKCRCWCGGRFHGINGGAAREYYLSAFNALPRTEAEFEKTTRQPDLFDEPETLQARDSFRKAER